MSPTEIAEFNKKVKSVYKPPFRYDDLGGYIWDANNNMVADEAGTGIDIARVRGFGRLSNITDDPEKIQDRIGEMIAEALTDYWTKNDD